LETEGMISVIIPAYNEEKALPLTLENLLRQRGRYEVIVVDGGSTDRTRDIARRISGVRLITAPKGRAVQMNTAAKTARGHWLLFLHADTLLPEGALRGIEALTPDSGCRAGGFLHRFSGSDPRLRLISWIDNLRTRTTRIIYGDQALFVRRTTFAQLGGFPEESIVEDILFSEKLKKITRPVLLNMHVITDSRKFEQMGVWRSLIRCGVILFCHGLHLPIGARRFFTDVR
jgi:rSAM/selenodomain-associated transferase 2